MMDKMKKYVIVSGAGSGIGKDICKELFKKGYHCIALGRREEPLKQVSEDFISVDLGEEGSQQIIKNYINEINDGLVVGVVNNAGIYRPQSAKEYDLKVWSEQLAVNLLGAVRLTYSALDHLKESKGSIVNISSTLGIRPIANTAAYSASKAAMNNWTLSLAIELAEFGVRANAICPGIVETPIHEFNQTQDQALRDQLNASQPLQRIGQPQDISPLTAHLISPDSSWTTGGIFNVDGGILLKS